MEIDKREFKGIWIPAELWLDIKLSAIQKVIYAEVDSFCSKGKSCFFSNEYLAKFCNVSIPTITRLIADMIDNGYLHQEGFDGRKRYLKTLKVLPNQNDQADSSKCNRQPDHFDEHNNTYTNTTKKVSKDTYRCSENTEHNTKEIKLSPFIERWNNYPLLTKHKSPLTKTYKDSHTFCLYLTKGSLGKHCDISREFLDRNDIPVDLVNKKWSVEEIYDSFRRFNDMMKEGYWPEDKSQIKGMSLKMFLYNYHTHSSFFLKVMAKEPQPIRRIEPVNASVIEMYRTLLGRKIRTATDEERLIREVNRICRWYDSLSEVIQLNIVLDSGCENYFGKIDKFVEIHIKWLQAYYKDNLTVFMLNKNPLAFLSHVGSYYHYNFDPDEAELKKMKSEARFTQEMKNDRKAIRELPVITDPTAHEFI